ncbi:MAG: permease-like cell division protein FtsX [Halioglobus sp.]
MTGSADKATRRGGASLSRADLRDRYKAWLQHHRLCAADSLAKVLEAPVASLLTWLVIGIALALPVGLNVALENVQRLSEGWDSPAQMSVFLRRDVSVEQGDRMREELSARADVDKVIFLSRDDALAEFSRLSGFADVVASLESNPLPDVLLVTPASALPEAGISTLREAMATREGVAEVVLDMAWLKRLQHLMTLGQRFVLAVGVMLILGVVLILGNTIRLAIESRREEIVVVKLVGGSSAFARRPFLYTGLWYGVGGGLAAGLLVSAALWYLDEPVRVLAGLYESSFSLLGLGLMGVLNLVILGGVLGLAGAWLAVARHLVRIEPR